MKCIVNEAFPVHVRYIVYASRKQSSQLFGAKQEDHFGIKIDLVDGRRTALVSLLVGLLTGLGEGLSSFLKFLWLYKPGEPMETLSLYNHCHSLTCFSQQAGLHTGPNIAPLLHWYITAHSTGENLEDSA